MEARELATVELLGALAYGQLRAFETTARAIPHAPSSAVGAEIARFAVDEHRRFTMLHGELAVRTQLPAAVMDRQRSQFDEYFDRAPMTDWFGVSTFFALGLPIAADFGRAIAPSLDRRAGEVVVASLDRAEVSRIALQRLAALLETDEDRERARGLAADLLGRALTGFRQVMDDTDALEVLLASGPHAGESGERRVKRLAIDVLDGHRRRVVELGLEDLDDVS